MEGDDLTQALRRIAKARREISEIRMQYRKAFSRKHQGEEIDRAISEMFERSLIIEPDGAGLAWIVQSARELIAY